jgi:hypothetical protein
MKDFILPIIAFVVGLISLYVDSKDKRKKWIFIFCLFITVSATIIFNSSESKKKDKSLIESKRKEDDLTQILLNINTYTKQIPDLVSMLRKFGYTEENAEKATSEQINNAISANQMFNESLSKISTKSASKIRIEYFPKDVDGTIINDALKNAGFSIVKKPPINSSKTNAIWAGDSVTVAEIKVVALVLFRSGINLITIERFQSNRGNKSNLIQIGTDPFILRKPTFKLQDIINLDI